MAILLLIRHGQNDMVDKKLAGRLADVHLNAQGQTQARRLADELALMPVKAVFSSPLERAQETAQVIAHAHNLPVLIDEGLIEMDFGLWQGKAFEQLRQSPLWKNVQDSPEGFRFPEGETFTTAQVRIAQALQMISQAYAEKDVIVCVSHCDAIRLAVAYFLDMPLNAFQRLRVNTASVTVLHLVNNRAILGAINTLTDFTF